MEDVRGVAAELHDVLVSLAIVHRHDAIPELVLELVRLHLQLFERLGASLAEVRLVVHEVLDAAYHD